jgi:hypothetical protein
VIQDPMKNLAGRVPADSGGGGRWLLILAALLLASFLAMVDQKLGDALAVGLTGAVAVDQLIRSKSRR